MTNMIFKTFRPWDDTDGQSYVLVVCEDHPHVFFSTERKATMRNFQGSFSTPKNNNSSAYSQSTLEERQQAHVRSRTSNKFDWWEGPSWENDPNDQRYLHPINPLRG